MDFGSICDAVDKINEMAQTIGDYDLENSSASLARLAELQDVDGIRARLIELQSERGRLLGVLEEQSNGNG
jgi:hypothetical protein